MSKEQEKINHVIGHARTIATTLLAVEYLRAHMWKDIHGDQISFRFKDPTAQNGFWSSDIIVVTYSIAIPDLETSNKMVSMCRAFVAGRGEIWG